MKKNRRILLAVLCAAFVLTVSGCGKEEEGPLVEMKPAPAVTATPTPVPVTSTPTPTPTPGPRTIGEKNTASRFIYLTNSTETDVRQIYVKSSDKEDWGKNLIPAESSVKAAEQVRMYYTPSKEEGDHTYGIKLLMRDGKAYEISSVSLEDIEKASLHSDGEQGIVYLRYMSLSEKKEKNTRDTATQSSDSDSRDDSHNSSDDDNHYENSNYYDNSDYGNDSSNHNDYGNDYYQNDNGYHQNDGDDNSGYDEEYGEFGWDYDGGYDDDYGYGYDEDEDWDYDDFGYDENYAEYDENGNLIWEQSGNR